MAWSTFVRVIGACLALAVLSACGGLQSQSPPLSLAAARDAAHSGDLLYVSDQNTVEVYVFTYPGGRRVGTLTGFRFPEGLCADTSGNVYVTDQGAGEVVEYAHGGTSPIKTLKDSQYPIACAVDPATGNLAVADESGDVSVYSNASGEPAVYKTPFVPLWCAYDDSGDLFADSSGAPHIQIAKLPKGGSSFESVSYGKRNNGAPAGLQWVSGHLAVGSAGPYQRSCCARIYRFRVSGTDAKPSGRTFIHGAMNDFFVEGGTVVTASGGHSIAFYAYPQGGRAQRVISDPGGNAYSVVVSAAP